MTSNATLSFEIQHTDIVKVTPLTTKLQNATIHVEAIGAGHSVVSANISDASFKYNKPEIALQITKQNMFAVWTTYIYE